MDIDPNHQNLQINLRSDDDDVQGSVEGDAELTFNFSRVIQIPHNYVVNISANEVEIPHSWYTFDVPMKFEVYYGLYSVPLATYKVEIDIPLRFYSACGFVKFVNAAFKAGAITAGYPIPPTFSFDCNTLHFRATADPSYSWTWQATMRDALGNEDLTISQRNMVARFLGVIPPVTPTAGYIRIQSTIAGITFESVNCVDTSRYHNIYLTFGGGNTTGSIDSRTFAGESVLAKMPINAPFGSIISYSGNTLDSYLYHEQSLNRLTISLRDHTGLLINLNGTRFNVSLLIQFIKREIDLVRDLPAALPYPEYLNDNAKRESDDMDLTTFTSGATNRTLHIMPKLRRLFARGGRRA